MINGANVNSSDPPGSGDGFKPVTNVNNGEENQYLVSADTLRALMIYFTIERESKSLLYGSDHTKVQEIQAVLDLLKVILTRNGYEPNFTRSGLEAMKEAARWCTSLIP